MIIGFILVLGAIVCTVLAIMYLVAKADHVDDLVRHGHGFDSTKGRR